MKYFLLFWLLSGVFAETVMYFVYEDCKEDGTVCYGGKGKTSKIATKENNPEIYYRRMEEMRRGLWYFPLAWLLALPFIWYKIETNKAVEVTDTDRPNHDES